MRPNEPSGASDWDDRIAMLRTEWARIERCAVAVVVREVAEWGDRLAVMRAEQSRVAADGNWTSGEPTLMGALWMQHNEVVLTRALAWLLRPDGRHRMGRALLDLIAERVGLPPLPPDAEIDVVTEEARRERESGRETRADLVVYGPSWTLVIEAKVYAAEQPDQLDRLADLWGEDIGPCFVFLTRGRRTPRTARRSAGQWQALTWADVAALLRAAVVGRRPRPGVEDFIETLEAYHRV